MSKVTKIIIAVLVAAFAGICIWGVTQKSAAEVDYSKYDVNSVIGANDDNGQIADHVEGLKDGVTPQVYLFEYADYQCPGCATMWPRLQKLVEEYNGQVGLVYRSYILSYHQNGNAAAAAANAAGLQGYWAEYATLLFANQSEWEYADTTARTDYFKQYFATASNNSGDVDKFVSDLDSANVKKKISFDVGLANKVTISGTPAIYLDGELVDWSNASSESDFLELMKSKIDPKLVSAQAN